MAARKNHGVADSVGTEVKAPEVKAPEVKAPEVKAPEVKAPETALNRRARLKAELKALPPVERIEGDALDSYLIFDGTPVGDNKSPTFYMIHRSGRRSPNGDRPVYYLTAHDFMEFDPDRADISDWTVKRGIPIVAGYVYSPDADLIEVRPWPRAAVVGWEKIEKKVRKGLAKRDLRWLSLRGLI